MSKSEGESFTYRFGAALATGVSLVLLVIGWNINNSTQRANDCAMPPDGKLTLLVAAVFAVIDIIVGIAAVNGTYSGRNPRAAGRYGLWAGALLLIGALAASFAGSTSCGS
jgi:hypothetical protein